MPTVQSWKPPTPPEEPEQEGGRWRWHRPSSDDVAAWFATQPLDEQMRHDDYIGGVVLIPQSEKVKYTTPNGDTVDRYEQVFTPYVQIGTRVGYFHRLAEARDLIPVIEPADVPRSQNPNSIYFNGHMDDGLWWHVVADSNGNSLRYLCATYRVALYERQAYMDRFNGKVALPLREGRGTKQVTGGPDPNGIMKAQTGAIGRALGVAGVLVIGTGIATAEDMAELPGYGAAAPKSDDAQLPASPELPEGSPPVPQSATEELESLRAQAIALQTRLQENAPAKWQTFVAWWRERAQAEGWADLNAVPLEGLKSLVAYMERLEQAQTPSEAGEAQVQQA